MINLLFGLILTILLSFTPYAQHNFVLDLKDKLSSENILNANDSHKLIIAKEFSEKFNGTFIVEGYIENDVVKIAAVSFNFTDLKSFTSAKIAISGCDGGYRVCARGCTNHATETGVLLCTVYSMIDCSGF
jgi:hypothetical protein